MRLVSVRWVDAVFSLDDGPQPEEAETVGFLVEDTPTHVVVAGERFDDGTLRARTAIPRECIRKVRTLK